MAPFTPLCRLRFISPRSRWHKVYWTLTTPSTPGAAPRRGNVGIRGRAGAAGDGRTAGTDASPAAWQYSPDERRLNALLQHLSLCLRGENGQIRNKFLPLLQQLLWWDVLRRWRGFLSPRAGGERFIICIRQTHLQTAARGQEAAGGISRRGGGRGSVGGSDMLLDYFLSDI